MRPVETVDMWAVMVPQDGDDCGGIDEFSRKRLRRDAIASYTPWKWFYRHGYRAVRVPVTAKESAL